MPRIGRPPGSVNRILKHDLAKLRALFAERLGARKSGDVTAHHVDRLFAELLGEPLPRRSRTANGAATNGHTPIHDDDLEAFAAEALAEVNRTLTMIAALFDTPPPLHDRKNVERVRSI